jgi:hypothetical protein
MRHRVCDQTRPSALPALLEGLRRAVWAKEHELAEVDLMLADYHSERARLLCDLRRLRAQLRDAEEAASSVSPP